MFCKDIVAGSTASSVQQLRIVKAAAHVADHANCLQLVYMMYHLNFAHHLQRLYFDTAMHECV